MLRTDCREVSLGSRETNQEALELPQVKSNGSCGDNEKGVVVCNLNIRPTGFADALDRGDQQSRQRLQATGESIFPKETKDAFTRRMMLSTPKQQMSITLIKNVCQTNTKREGREPVIITASQDQRQLINCTDADIQSFAQFLKVLLSGVQVDYIIWDRTNFTVFGEVVLSVGKRTRCRMYIFQCLKENESY